jgi:hypothetical protein
MYIFAPLKLLNFTTSLYILYSFVLQSIEYHRLRQARGEGHDTHPTERVEKKRFAHLRLALNHSMSFYVHYLTECLFRTNILPNIHTHIYIYIYIHGQYIRSRKTRLEEGRM